jgi:uncharacterized protein YuzE
MCSWLRLRLASSPSRLRSTPRLTSAELSVGTDPMVQSGLMPRHRVLRLSHDPSVGAAYIDLQPHNVTQPVVARTEPAGTSVHVDFDDQERLVGIEVLSTELLHPSLLAEADRDASTAEIKSDAELDDMVLHIRYEVLKMINFLAVGNAWVEGIDGLPEEWGVFAAESMLEAALIHTRCVAEFLRRSDQPSDTVTARDYVTDWHWTDGEGLKNDLAEIHGRVAHLGLIRLSVQHDDRAFRWDDFLRTAAVPTLLRGFREFLHRLEPDKAELFNQPRQDNPRIDLVAEIDRVIGS